MANKKINVAIIGAGRIGAFFDKPGDKNILTHAHAFVAHPKFNLVGFVDTDFKKAQMAAKVWGGRGYNNLKNLFDQEQVEAISICVPDEYHYKILSELKRKQIKGGIIEKPLSNNLNFSKKMISDKFISKFFLVNYSLRYTPEFVAIRKSLINNKFGKLLVGNGYYGKGLIHNGSHLIDLLLFFGLKIKKISILDKIIDFNKKDPTYSLFCQFKQGGDFVLQGVSAKKYTVFEIDLLFEKCRIRIKDKTLAIDFFDVQKDLNFAGYQNLTFKKQIKTRRLTNSMYNMVDDLYKVIIYKRKPQATIKEAYLVQKLLSL